MFLQRLLPKPAGIIQYATLSDNPIFCIIGMSNIGKTRKAQRLKDEFGFNIIDCDARTNRIIPEEVANSPLAKQHQGIRLDTVEQCAAWMGQPGRSNPDYAVKSEIFSRSERRAMLDIIRWRANNTQLSRPTVIDTCGSVIYTGDDVLEMLRGLTHIVYLAANPDHEAKLLQKYISNPKPLLWRDRAFVQKPGQSDEEARAESYPRLLATRDMRYRALAHRVVPYEEHYGREANLKAIFQLVT